MTTTNSNEVIDKLPEIGDFIKVRDDKLGARIATVISMAECKKLAPELWTDAFGRLRDDDESDTYGPGDVIRAYKFENGDAEFCIMRFSDTSRQGVSFNKHIFKHEQPLLAQPHPKFPMQAELDVLYAKLKETTDSNERQAIKNNILALSYQCGTK